LDFLLGETNLDKQAKTVDMIMWGAKSKALTDFSVEFYLNEPREVQVDLCLALAALRWDEQFIVIGTAPDVQDVIATYYGADKANKTYLYRYNEKLRIFKDRTGARRLLEMVKSKTSDSFTLLQDRLNLKNPKILEPD
jgi:hypothetical protein